MADTDSGAPATAQAGASTPRATRPQLGIQSQYVKDLSFENPAAPGRLAETESAPDIKVNVQVEARALTEATYEVSLQITADARQDEAPVFLLELTYNGVFSFIDVPKEALEPALLVECPRLIFPFARRIVADVTRDGGFPPLLLTPIDFLALYRGRQAQGAESEAPADGTE